MRIPTIIAAIAVVLAMAAPSSAPAQELRIGLVTTLSGGGALLGQELQRGFELGMAHQGWSENGDELAGVPTRVFVEDDQQEPEVALRAANRLVRENEVHILGGVIWSNVLMALRNPVVDSRTILMSMNAGASPIAGQLCSQYFISTSWQNDTWSESMGQLMNDEDIGTVFILVPNYQAGKDNVEGFQRRFNGEVIGRSLYPLGNRDFQAEISRIRDAGPEAVFAFAPGGDGIAFMKQWASSGASDEIRLYTVFTVNWLTLRPIGEDAIGTFHVNFWNVDLENDANARFVRDFIARHERNPSHFAAQAYDAAALIASGVRAVDGDVEDTLALNRAMRQADFESVRGPFEFNVNGMPIQNFYKRTVVADDSGNPVIRTTGVVYNDYRDSYADACPSRQHLE